MQELFDMSTFENMNQYNVTYYEKNKPTSTRKFSLKGDYTYEQILFENIIDVLCKRKYQIEYMYFMLREHVFISRVKLNGGLCIYSVRLFHEQHRSKLLAQYEVEIECLKNLGRFDITTKKEKLITDELEEIKIEKETEKNSSIGLPTKWVSKERHQVQMFLFQFFDCGSLEKLREIYTKPTYYRILKICKEKGYIANDKLIRKIYVQNPQKNRFELQ